MVLLVLDVGDVVELEALQEGLQSQRVVVLEVQVQVLETLQEHVELDGVLVVEHEEGLKLGFTSLRSLMDFLAKRRCFSKLLVSCCIYNYNEREIQIAEEEAGPDGAGVAAGGEVQAERAQRHHARVRVHPGYGCKKASTT